MSHLLLALWIMCGVVAHGITFAYFQREYPYFAWKHRGSDRMFAVLLTVMGPLGLVISWLMSNYAEHGMMYSGLTREESIEAHKRQWPSLRVDF